LQELGCLQRQQSKKEWQNKKVKELTHSVVGVIGLGSIGTAVVQKAAVLGMEVHALRRRQLGDEQSDVIMHYGDDGLNELLVVSDFVVCTLPLTHSTNGMLGKKQFAMMKPEAVLVNVGRGEVVDDDALVSALQAGTIRGAVLEVFKVEPLPIDHIYWSMENVLIAPHCADNTDDQHSDALAIYQKNLKNFIGDRPLTCVVDRNEGY